MTKLIIGADLVPTKSNQKEFSDGNIEALIDKNLLQVLSEADYRIFNLEVPLTDIKKPIKKAGPNLIAPTASIKGIKKLNIDFLTLANNHILDQDVQGLYSTVKVLQSNSIAFAGVGKDLEEAAKSYIAIINGIKVGIYCCAEHEFTIAADNIPGANPFDPLNSLDHIADLRKQCDYLICLYHGGKEHYRYPSPNLQKVCRRIVDKGADLVICQHTHCVGCEEKYKEATIVYGQGNFLFDDSDNEYWNTSLLVQVNIEENLVNYIPIKKNGKGVNIADGDAYKDILNGFYKRTEEIKKDEFVKNNYAIFAHKIIQRYLLAGNFIVNTILYRGINKLSGYRIGNQLVDYIIRRQKYWFINQYECEAHREIVLAALKNSK